VQRGGQGGGINNFLSDGAICGDRSLFQTKQKTSHRSKRQFKFESIFGDEDKFNELSGIKVTDSHD